jgi:hypothetical protein
MFVAETRDTNSVAHNAQLQEQLSCVQEAGSFRDQNCPEGGWVAHRFEAAELKVGGEVTTLRWCSLFWSVSEFGR